MAVVVSCLSTSQYTAITPRKSFRCHCTCRNCLTATVSCGRPKKLRQPRHADNLCSETTPTCATASEALPLCIGCVLRCRGYGTTVPTLPGSVHEVYVSSSLHANAAAYDTSQHRVIPSRIQITACNTRQMKGLLSKSAVLGCKLRCSRAVAPA